MANWKDLVKTVAPALATALGGPLAGVATRVLGEAVLGDGEASEDQLAAALASPKPEVLAQIRKADQEFQVQLKELDIKLEELHQRDRESARRRDVETRDGMNAGLAIIIVIGFFLVLLGYFFLEIPEGSATAMNICLGALTAGFIKVLDYYYGTNKSSAQKTAIIANQQKGGNP